MGKQERNNQSSRKRPRKWPWFTIVGSVLLFLAWAVQNLFTGAITKSLARLQMDAQEISLAELGTADSRLAFLRERAAPEPDSAYLALMALSYVRGAAHQVYKANEALNNDSLATLLAARSAIFDAANARYKAGNIRGLVEMAVDLLALESGTSGSFYHLLQKKQANLQNMEQLGEAVQSAFYIVGSILLGLGFLSTSVFGRKNESQAA